MKVYPLLFSLLLFCNNIFAVAHPDQKYRLVKAESYVQSKNYYFLTLLQQLPSVSKIISTDEELSKIAILKKNYLLSSLKDCGDSVRCYFENIKFSAAEIQSIGDRLVTLYSSRNEIKSLVTNHLIPSGCYNIFESFTPQEMLRKAWEQDAKAVNHAIKVYVGGGKSNYPSIDAASFDMKWKEYPILIYDCSNAVLEDVKNDKLFFITPMTYALRAIEINDRNRAGDYEPMALNCNKSAYNRIKTIRWADYKYSVILVPGEGPEIHDEAISPLGKLRCRIAAYRWKEGLAPFMLVSGGKAHPYKTKYCEAEEMKKYLVETMHIPPYAIIMEPHARHTTTNMRNCARLLFRYGFPFEKPCITSTTKEQSFYITDKEMQDRCIEELGYSPYKNGKRLSETEAEFYPLVSSLQIDFDEPMDP